MPTRSEGRHNQGHRAPARFAALRAPRTQLADQQLPGEMTSFSAGRPLELEVGKALSKISYAQP